jgi:long-subunit fatty acid transport protein
MGDIVVMKMLYRNVTIATVLLSSQAQAGWIQSLGQSEHCIAMGGACVANKGDFGSDLVIKLDDPLLGFVNDLNVEYDANDTLTWRTGLGYQFNNKWSVQFSYAYDESIFDDEHVDILVYDSNRNILTTGISYDSAKVNKSGRSATLGVQIIIYESRTIEAGESQNLGGFSLPNLLDGDTLSFSSNREAFEYGGTILAVGLSFQHQF